MPASDELAGERCNCLAVRQAARHVTQLYDRFLAPLGLRGTQYSLLRALLRRGPLPISELARALVMDRTTLARNLKPLQRDGFIEVTAGADDGRQRLLGVTPAGCELFGRAQQLWTEAQACFEAGFGAERSLQLRETLRAVVSTRFPSVGSDEQ